VFAGGGAIAHHTALVHQGGLGVGGGNGLGHGWLSLLGRFIPENSGPVIWLMSKMLYTELHILQA
jgi:hypothetical protein